jgi:hypothetical protein
MTQVTVVGRGKLEDPLKKKIPPLHTLKTPKFELMSSLAELHPQHQFLCSLEEVLTAISFVW